MTRAALTGEFTAAGIEIDACWKRIGVQGDKSCPELARHAHCRNCAAFSLAATSFLDRDLPGQTEASQISQPRSDIAAPEVPTESVTIFRVGAEWFALPTLALDEIIGLRPIHSLPHRRNQELLGLVNVRGELVICVSIAELLGASGRAGQQGRLIVARHSSGRLAFPVDEVQHTHHHRPDELQPVPATVARSDSRLTIGLLTWRGKTVGRLDEHMLFAALGKSLAR